MEGKAVLFKKFAGIDVFDIEVAELDVDKLVDIIVALEPTFGGVNLEDIKGPECSRSRRRPRPGWAFRYSTTISMAPRYRSAAIVDALELPARRSTRSRSFARARALRRSPPSISSSRSAQRENIVVSDIEGVVDKGREKLMDRWKAVYARETSARTLADAFPAPTFSSASRPAGSSSPPCSSAWRGSRW